MLSQVYYIIRSRLDGNYLTANFSQGSSGTKSSYLLMFREDFEALSYLNTHASDLSDRFAVESIPGTQITGLMKRWGFAGVGIVQDPLLPQVEFLSSVS
ncbi:hypothetical protein NDA01_00985 [Trichocoleus desertorum AS-A10]|uniref:hypothetical protein n=1 Tax=Trichocoleus desertorum TaxID=1481672 RepID=UPI003296E03D